LPSPETVKIVVLHDAVPENANPDHLDVLVQAKAVSHILSDLGYEPIEVALSLDLRAFVDTLSLIAPALAFNLVESVDGQGSLAPFATAILDHRGIPYTGSKTDALFLTSHKLIAKRLLSQSGIATPSCLSSGDLENHPFHGQGLYIIKSLWEHASLGLDEDSVIFAENAEQLSLALKHRQQTFGGEYFAETYVEGREFNLSLLASAGEPRVLSPAEIRFEDYPPDKRKIVDYRAKWEETSFEYIHTHRCFSFPPADTPLLEKMVEIAKKCWEIFGLRGYARVDFRADEAGEPWVLEVNANPCLSPDAGFVAAALHGGLGMAEVVTRILEAAGLHENGRLPKPAVCPSTGSGRTERL
jgi:D-alanine-D-alanine ligase